MRTKVLSTLLVVTVLWACTSTFLYLRLKLNPRVVAVTTDFRKNQLAQAQLGDMEKLSFLRQFVEQYNSYNSNNFWQTQTTLAFLMDIPLREKRIHEVSRLKERVQKKAISQKVSIKNIAAAENDLYLIDLNLLIEEEKQSPQELNMQVKTRLRPTERTLENPWGLLVTSMEYSTSKQNFTPALYAKAQSPTVVTFPCAIENIENSNEDIKTKITTLNISEVQLVVPEDYKTEAVLKAICKNQEFTFKVHPMTEIQTLYKVFPLTASTTRRDQRVKTKDIYDKTIENVLGIKVD